MSNESLSLLSDVVSEPTDRRAFLARASKPPFAPGLGEPRGKRDTAERGRPDTSCSQQRSPRCCESEQRSRVARCRFHNVHGEVPRPACSRSPTSLGSHAPSAIAQPHAAPRLECDGGADPYHGRCRGRRVDLRE